jgi:hypothetical protein
VLTLKYEVAYISKSGNTATLAEAIAEMLPNESVHLTDLAYGEAAEDADVYLLGFGINRGAVPLKIMDSMELAEGKTILLFITCGVEPTAEYQASVERTVLPFLPDDCDYRGMFLCPGQFPDEVVRYLREVLQRQPDNAQAQSLLTQYEKTCGHPNNSDIEHLRVFLSDNLTE